MEETITAGGAVPQSLLVTSERVTVTDPVTGVSTMVTPGVGVTWCAAQTTAGSSDSISMRRTTAARSRQAIITGETPLPHK